MSRRVGLQIRDAWSLSSTKFKMRRIRTALTLISTSVLALVLVVASSVLAGLMDVADSTPQTALVDRHLAKVYNNYIDTPEAANAAKAEQDFKSKYGSVTGLEKIYYETQPLPDSSMSATLDLLPPPKNQDTSDGPYMSYFGRPLEAVSSPLVDPYLSEGQSLDWKPGDPLPILVPMAAVTDPHSRELESIEKAKPRVAKREEYKKAILGKVGTLTLKSQAEISQNFSGSQGFRPGSTESLGPPSQDLKVRVVGFLPSAGLVSSDEFYAYAVPYEVAQKSPELSKMLGPVSALYPSFDSSQHRNAFVKGKDMASIYGDPIAANKDYFDPLKNAFRIAVIVMLVLMAIPMAATMSKLLADSQRETGVFRAIGATNHTMVGIYGFYAFQMVVASFIVAVVVGAGICLWLTGRYGDDLELAVSEFASTNVHASLLAFDFKSLATIFGGLLGGAALGAAFPLWRALRRDPIKALREG